MIIGIVGPEQRKFTPDTEAKARFIIKRLMKEEPDAIFRSGHCPHGGVDIFMEEEGLLLGVKMDIRAPKTLSWNGDYGYKARNIDIAKSDRVVVIVVKKYPPDYLFENWEMRLKDKGCFHCEKAGRPFDHVKSGACYTATKHKELLNRDPVYYVV